VQLSLLVVIESPGIGKRPPEVSIRLEDIDCNLVHLSSFAVESSTARALKSVENARQISCILPRKSLRRSAAGRLIAYKLLILIGFPDGI
jgi:tRNA threonylcarbamoyladenosine modification (KEOPS) complex Cgi121 subunit